MCSTGKRQTTGNRLKDAECIPDELLLKCRRKPSGTGKPEISLYEGVKELFFELHAKAEVSGS